MAISRTFRHFLQAWLPGSRLRAAASLPKLPLGLRVAPTVVTTAALAWAAGGCATATPASRFAPSNASALRYDARDLQRWDSLCETARAGVLTCSNHTWAV